MSVKTSGLLKSLILGRGVTVRKFLSRYVVNIDPLPTRYGGKTNITVIPGSGVGPEVMSRTLEVLTAAQAPLSYEIFTFGVQDDEESAREFENVLTSIRRNKVALKGNIEIQSKDPYAKSRNILLRKNLDLFAYVLRFKSYPGINSTFDNVDVTLIRQNTEGEYLMLEHEAIPGSVQSLKIVTRYASEKLAKFAFEHARDSTRKHVTVVHNAGVQVRSEGLFLRAVLDVSRDYPEIPVSVIEIRRLITQIIMKPSSFDIILTTNLNGSIVSSVLNGMVGGCGLTAGANIGEDGMAVFEPGARNKGSSIVGKGIANPIAMINAGINLLEYLGYHKTAQMLDHSVYETLVHDKVLTADMGGKATTEEITRNVIRHVGKQLLLKTQTGGKPFHHRWRSYCELPGDSGGKAEDGTGRRGGKSEAK